MPTFEENMRKEHSTKYEGAHEYDYRLKLQEEDEQNGFYFPCPNI